MTAIAGISYGALPRQDLLETVELYEVVNERDKFLRIAPLMDVRARHSRMQKEGTNSLLNEAAPENPVNPVTWNAPARTAAIEWATFDIDLLRYAHDGLIISNHDLEEGRAYAIDPEAKWFKDSFGHALAILGRRQGVTLATSGNYAGANQSTSLAINVPTADLVAAVQAVKQRFRDSGVGAENIIAVCNDVMLDLMTSLDQVREQVAITGFTSSESAVRRTGTVTSEEVVAWFKVKFNIDLIVVETRTIRSTGTATPVIANDLYFLKADAGPAGASFLKTGIRSDYGGSWTMPTQYPVHNPEGIGYYMDTVFGLGLPSNLLGFVYLGIDS